MSDDQWESLGRMNVRFLTPLDANILKVVPAEPDEQPYTVLRVTLGSGDEIQDIVLHPEDALQLVSLIITRLSHQGDPCASEILSMLQHRQPPPATD